MASEQRKRSLVREIAQAAEHGAPEAQFRLGLMCSGGHQVAADLVLAHKWFNLAAAAGYEAGREYRQEVAAVMSEEEVATAQLLARDWRPAPRYEDVGRSQAAAAARRTVTA